MRIMDAVRAAVLAETDSATLLWVLRCRWFVTRERVLAILIRHPELHQVFEGRVLRPEARDGDGALPPPAPEWSTPVDDSGAIRRRTRSEAAADAISLLAPILRIQVHAGRDIRRKVDSMRELLAHLHPEGAPDLARLHTAEEEARLAWFILDRIRVAVELEDDADADDIAEAVERLVERVR
ncbi:MAG: hypothetical protein ABMA64_42915 [Myxococcota bacterium]